MENINDEMTEIKEKWYLRDETILILLLALSPFSFAVILLAPLIILRVKNYVIMQQIK